MHAGHVGGGREEKTKRTGWTGLGWINGIAGHVGVGEKRGEIV